MDRYRASGVAGGWDRGKADERSEWGRYDLARAL